MSDKNKDFRVDYMNFSTRKEAEQYAKRSTAKSFSPVDIYQKVATTVVPEIDVQINSVDVTIENA